MSVVGTLHESLLDAGLPVVSVSIGRRGDKSTWRVDFAPEATDEQKIAAAAAIKAFDPASVKEPRVVDFETMQERLTDAEWQALQAACAADVPLARQYERAKTRGTLNLNDPEVVTAFAGLVRAGLFTYARLAELAGVDSLP